MRSHWRKLAVAFALCGSAVSAQEITQTTGFRRPCPPPTVCPAPVPLGPDGKPLTPSPMTPPDSSAVPPSTDAFSQAGESGTLAASSFAPAFFGDLIGVSSTRFVLKNFSTFPNGTVVRTPSAAHSGAWKIADDESPRPMDRVYYNFNWFSDVNRSANLSQAGGTSFNVFRHIIGVEKTLFNERMSVGLRLPLVDVEGPPQLSDREFADMSIIWKLALVSDPCHVLSTGMVITVPTGQGFFIDQPGPRGTVNAPNPDRIVDVLLQPYIGYWRHLTDRTYFHSFNSIAIPTDSRDVVIMCNDIGFGLWLYRNPCDRFVQSVVPTIELHLNTPLTDRGSQTIPIGFSDQLNLTLGTYVTLPRATLGFAVGIPLLGPRPYDTELIANVTMRF